MKYENIKEHRDENGMVTLTADCRLGKNEIIFQGSENDLENFNKRNAIVYMVLGHKYIQNVKLATDEYGINYFA